MICPHIDLRSKRPPTIAEVEGPDTVSVGNSVVLFCRASGPDGVSLNYSWRVDGKNDSLMALVLRGKKGVDFAKFTPVTVAHVLNAQRGGSGWPNVEFWAPSVPGVYTIVVTVRDDRGYEARFEKHMTVLKKRRG